MSTVNWGVPNQRTRHVEKYPDTPVMTMKVYTGEKGTSRGYVLNKKAIEALGYTGEGEERISFSFDERNITIGNTTNMEGIPSYRVTKKGNLSDKKTFDFISKLLSLDNTIENEFSIEINGKEEGSPITASVTLMNDSNQNESPAETVDENQVDLEESIEEIEAESNDHSSGETIEESFN